MNAATEMIVKGWKAQDARHKKAVAERQTAKQAKGQTVKHVTKVRKDSAHGFHLLMTLLTGGLWLPFVYLPLVIQRRVFKKRQVTKSYVPGTIAE